MTQERARFTILEPGRIATYSGHKLRARAAAGLGEDLSEAHALNRRMRELSRTQAEGARPDPHVITPEDVTRGLGVPLGVEERIHGLVRDSISPSEGQKTLSAKRFASARSRLLDFMRTQKSDVDSDARAEIMRRATHYWRKNFRVDYGRSPELTMGKALVIPASKLLAKADPGMMSPRDAANFAGGLIDKAKGAFSGSGKKVAGEGVSPTGRVSMHPVVHDAATGKVGHKYIAKKPDGHGGWLYKYPGDSEFRPGAGIEEGHTKAPPGAHLAAHESGFKPSMEQDESGGQKLHFGEDVHAHVPANADREHHRVEHAKHGAAYKQAMADGDHEKAKAHLKAYQLHAELHNRQLRAERKAAQGGMAPPGAVPPEMASAADGKQPKAKAPQLGQAVGPQAGGTMPGAPGGAPSQQRPPTPGPGAAGGSSAGPGPAGPPQGYAARTPPGADVGQYRQHLQAANEAMTNLVSTHAHLADLDSRMKAIRSGKEQMDPRMRKHMLAQLAAEKAQAELDRFQHEDAHDASMKQLHDIHTTLMKEKLKHHPVVKMIEGLLKLMSGFAQKMGHGESAEPKEAEKPGAESTEKPGSPQPAAMREKGLSRRAPDVTGVQPRPAAAQQDAGAKPSIGTAPTVATTAPAGDDWMAEARAKRDETERRASAAGDVWKMQQQAAGKDTAALIRENLKAPEGAAVPGALASREIPTKAPRATTGEKTIAGPRRRAAKSEELNDLRKALALAARAEQTIREHVLDDKRIIFTPPMTRRLRLEW